MSNFRKALMFTSIPAAFFAIATVFLILLGVPIAETDFPESSIRHLPIYQPRRGRCSVFVIDCFRH